MSGWIKLEKDRRDDPRVLLMAKQLRNAGVTHERFTHSAHVTLVLGCLDQLWCYADTHVRDDDALDIGVDDIDELVGLKGFASLMPSDWLEVIDAEHVKLPGFHAHNGTESRRKALTQKRVERHRDSVTQERYGVKRNGVTSALPDQDQTNTKTIEEEDKSPRASARTQIATYLPDDFSLTSERRKVAAEERVDADRTFETFVDYWRAAGGTKAKKRNWDATWRNWCKRAADYAADRGNGQKSLSAVERVQRATGVRL